MTHVPEGILIHGHMVAELDDLELESVAPVTSAFPPRVRSFDWRSWSHAILAALPTRALTAIGALALLLALACDDASIPMPPTNAVAVVIVTPEQRTLTVGDTAMLAATPRDGAGRALEGRRVAWTSSDTAIASVSSTGRVTAGRPGTAMISATSEGRVGRAVVTVARVPVHGSRSRPRRCSSRWARRDSSRRSCATPRGPSSPAASSRGRRMTRRSPR